jgi:alpha-ketoglutarate-dependent 2,4-dichlorophenoxyacetate dioxygenase
MSIKITPCSTSFVAHVDGLDLSIPLDPKDVRDIERAMDHYGVLIFRGQALRDDQHVSFALNFGEIELAPQTFDRGRRRLESDRVNDISNLGADGTILPANDRKRMFNLGNRLWHSDSSFKEVPAQYSLLYAHVVPPEGGETEFADMRAAWDALPEKLRQRVGGLDAEHSLLYSRSLLGFTEFNEDERLRCAPVRQPVVRTHPGSGRKSLFLSSHMGRIEGLLVPEGMELIRDLIEHATQREFVYRHHWKAGDLIIWDNRCTMHRGRPFDDQKYPRDMRRVTLSDSHCAAGKLSTVT